jgi:AcrR family transcriptional regulator
MAETTTQPITTEPITTGPITTGPITTDRRPGRPRSEDCDRAIEAAALDLLVEQGWAGVTMEGIALRAGVGKATVYRRWDNREDLILDSVVHRCAEHIVSPDTGSLRTDLIELYRGLLRKFWRDGDVLRAFTAVVARDPDLADAFRRTFLDERRAAARDVLTRGIERGELAADADLELLGDVGSALIWHRLSISGAPLDPDLPERIVNLILGPLTSPAAG